MLLITGKNAQFLSLTLGSFNNNMAGQGSLNNNANILPGPTPGRSGGAATTTTQRTTQNPFAAIPGLSAGIQGFILGSALGTSLRYPSGFYPYFGYYYPSFGYYYPYFYYRG
ncbi:putative integral membrane protein [Acanthocheilonema viteae]